MSESRPVGRPPSYSIETADLICERMCNGESLRQICRDKSMPCYSVVMKWAHEIPEFADKYAKARDRLLEYWADEQVDIADDGSNDWIEREHDSGRIDKVFDSEHVRRSQLRIDTRKWLMSKLSPRKYGDRVAHEVTGRDGGPITTLNAELSETTDPHAAAQLYTALLTAPK